jgi:RNA polymerase sigma-70 factor (ECF subfamily)
MSKEQRSASGGDANGRNRRSGPMSPVTTTFLECHGFLKKFLAGFLPAQQDIEDVAQEAYLRAYIAEQRESVDQPKAFLFRIAKNLALTKLTRKSRQITDYIEEAASAVVIDTGTATDKEVEAQQSLGLYCEAVALLPEKCRQVFLLRKVHGLPHREIAERMRLSLSSVEKYLRQGILACQAHIETHEAPSTSNAARSSSSREKVGP